MRSRGELRLSKFCFLKADDVGSNVSEEHGDCSGWAVEAFEDCAETVDVPGEDAESTGNLWRNIIFTRIKLSLHASRVHSEFSSVVAIAFHGIFFVGCDLILSIILWLRFAN